MSSDALERGTLLASCLVGILAGVLPSRSCGAGDMGPGRKQREDPAGPRIFAVLHDEKMTADQKARELWAIRGALSSEDASALSDFLKEQSGTLFVAVATTMLRCGAGSEATAVAQAVVSDRQSPLAQWTAALSAVGQSAWMPVKETRKALASCMHHLLDRLKHPSSPEELLAILRSTEFIWNTGNWWIVQAPVILELCELLNHKSPQVRENAVLVLAATPLRYHIPSAAVVALANVVVASTVEVRVAANGLLKDVLGIGPDAKDPDTVVVFWRNWLELNGQGFNLTWHALRRAAAPQELALHERQFLARQVMFSSRSLPKEEVAKVWAALRTVFDIDPSPDSERCSAWLYPLVAIAARDETGQVASQALSMLLSMLKEKKPILRQWALGQIGNLPGAAGAGSRAREALVVALRDSAGSPGERAHAAWSLREALKDDPKLVEEMIVLGETLQGQAEAGFSDISRSRCIGLVAGSLMEATGKSLSLNPSEWRAALADFLPPNK